VTPVPTRRYRLRRAIERGDPRLGLVVGVLLAALSATAFARRDWVGMADAMELKTLDFAFKQRPAIRESDKILLVDIDDVTLRELPWPIPRENYGQAILALDRLGAGRIVFDVQFKTTIPRPGHFDEETGGYVLEEGDRVLRFAIGRSGNVALAFSFDLENPLSLPLQRAFPSFKSAVAKNPGADLAEISRESGIPADLLKDELERAREQALVALVAESMEEKPEQSFPELRKAFLPDYDSRANRRELKLLQYAYWMWRCSRAIETRASPARIEGTLRASTATGVFPPLYYLLEPAQSVGCVNALPDSDGIMRRPWSHVVHRGRAYAYLGLEAAMTPGGPAAVVGESRVEAAGTVLPLDAEGRLLVNWAGNDRRPRSECFSHLPFKAVLEFYQSRYIDLDGNVRRTLRQMSAEERASVRGDEYLGLSDRLGEALQGKADLTPDRVRSIEDRMDRIRQAMLLQFREYIAANEKALTAMKNPPRRIREDAERRIAEWKAQVAPLAAAAELEATFHARVAGRICLIGSAYTASGDLHATPLGSATPGMDVLANVANMALTGQGIRRTPRWVDFVYLFGLGLLVSYYVTHWNAAGSAIATAITVAATSGVFWALFTGPAILIPGAGPVVTALLTFAGVTTYKELLTQRSKRKLQRELEKNTSPELVKILMEHPEWLSEPRRMTGTFFFSDVKSFTSMSEKMHADVLFPFINRYLDRETYALKAHQAFVDKYIGDGIMALFGIPVPTPDHARNACRAALDCQAALRPLNAENDLQGLPKIKARIGIHSGEVSAGNVGALDRSNYTVLGDNVNLAARLEGANKEYDTSIMISEATWSLVAGKFQVRELDRIRVVGKKVAVRIFELIAAAGEPLPFDPAFLDVYGRALTDFKERRWAEALKGFQQAMELKPGDVPSKTYIERAKVFQIMPPPADWEGVFELTSK